MTCSEVKVKAEHMIAFRNCSVDVKNSKVLSSFGFSSTTKAVIATVGTGS
jgi:hypothetical protein